jgi:hypothetical protein
MIKLNCYLICLIYKLPKRCWLGPPVRLSWPPIALSSPFSTRCDESWKLIAGPGWFWLGCSCSYSQQSKVPAMWVRESYSPTLMMYFSCILFASQDECKSKGWPKISKLRLLNWHQWPFRNSKWERMLAIPFWRLALAWPNAHNLPKFAQRACPPAIQRPFANYVKSCEISINRAFETPYLVNWFE